METQSETIPPQSFQVCYRDCWTLISSQPLSSQSSLGRFSDWPELVFYLSSES